MKKKSILFLLLTVLIAAVSSQAQTSETPSEKDAVKVPLNNYLQAHATGNPEFIIKAFQPDAKIIAMNQGKFFSRSVEEFAKVFSGKPAADETQRKRNIDTIDITGNAATAKITLDYPAVRFTDYMTLLKIDGEWKIVSKVYYAEPKTVPAAKPAN